MKIDLTTEQMEIFRNLLEERIADLGPELHHARSMQYHEMLKSLRETLVHLEAKLDEASADVMAGARV
jgi:hypothetical protein